MGERRPNSAAIDAWVRAHRDELDAVEHGSVTFVVVDGAVVRVKVEKSERVDDLERVSRLTA